MSNIKSFTADEMTFIVNIGDPELLNRVDGWKEQEDDLYLFEGDKITVEKYDKLARIVRDIIGDEQFNEAFKDGRDVFLLMELCVQVTPLIDEITKKNLETAKKLEALSAASEPIG